MLPLQQRIFLASLESFGPLATILTIPRGPHVLQLAYPDSSREDGFILGTTFLYAPMLTERLLNGTPIVHAEMFGFTLKRENGGQKRDREKTRERRLYCFKFDSISPHLLFNLYDAVAHAR